MNTMDRKNPHVDDLPRDWWRHGPAGIDFANYYQRLSLGLLIVVQTGASYQLELLSGFKIVHQERILWITAGHVIDDLNRVIRQRSAQIDRMLWIDPAISSEASYFVVHDRQFKRYSASSSGVDVGFAVLSDLDAMNIVDNPHSILMSSLLPVESNHIEPEGYYLVGYPSELGKFSQQDVDEAKRLNSFDSTLVCLPMEAVNDSSGEWPATFVGDDGVFFGQLVEFLDDGPKQPESIKGMSGGPAFGIARHPSNMFVYELIGIQSRWLPNRRIVRVEPLDRALRFVEETLA